ncbi:MAG: hypothetical protein NTX22_09125 [Ignavibacteriales bacterium]|nr:hypothetical protein [Ignavibacteriales bacterium]
MNRKLSVSSHQYAVINRQFSILGRLSNCAIYRFYYSHFPPALPVGRLSLNHQPSYILFYLLISISCFLISCAPTKTIETTSAYSTDFPLTTDIAYSSSSDLTVRIPKGWFTAEDKECKCTDLWLIRDDFSATINLITYEVDDTIRKHVIDGKMDTLVSYSKQLKKSKLKIGLKLVKEDEFFQLNEKPFAAYEYLGDEGIPIRVVLFQYQGRIFELSAMPAQKIGRGKVDSQELFRVQQSVLASIK